MLPFPNFIVAVVFIIMGIGFLLMLFHVSQTEEGIWGRPSIQPFLFYSGKISQFVSWGLFLVKALVPGFLGSEAPSGMMWAGTILLCLGTLVLLISFYYLGSSLKYGIPESPTTLKTSGLYRFSRNPLYLGVYILTIASMVYFPHILNIAVSLYCLTTCYLMILAEERFLAGRFGKEWDDYTRQVRRFL
jgi:protein-S-isoprenylcysteine O-methyltransferase Ste14